MDEIDIVEILYQELVDIDLLDYDGVCWIGFNLFFFSLNEIVQCYIDLCGVFFDWGVFQFGSCWVVQFVVKIVGGEVDFNFKGCEFGIV